MKKRIFLHIGKHKTGTTSIQHYLLRNADYFNGAGYYVVKNILFDCGTVGRTNLTNCTNLAHVAIRNSLQTPIRIRNRVHGRSYIEKIRTAYLINFKLHSIDCPNLIISSEAFSFIRKLHEIVILKIMFKGFLLTPIVFFREKNEWLRSWRHQMRNIMQVFDIESNVPRGVFDFRENSWLIDDSSIADIFGKQLEIINYETAVKMYRSVIPPFLESIGLEPSACPSCDDLWLNRTAEKRL